MKVSICIMRMYIVCACFFVCGCETDSLFRGYRFFMRGQYDMAIKQFTYYLNHSDDRDDNKEERAAGFFYRGLAWSMIKHGESAIPDYEAALSRIQDYFYASFNLGVEYFQMQQYVKSQNYFMKAWIGVVKAKNGELDHSKLWNRKSLDIDCEFCFLYCSMVFARTRNLQGLRHLLEDSKAISMTTENKSTGIVKGMIKNVLEDNPNGVEEIEKLLEDRFNTRKKHYIRLGYR